MGIIDILQPYNATKRIENTVKSLRYNKVFFFFSLSLSLFFFFFSFSFSYLFILLCFFFFFSRFSLFFFLLFFSSLSLFFPSLFLKVLSQGDISAVPPRQYGERFKNYFVKITNTDHVHLILQRNESKAGFFFLFFFAYFH